VDRSGKGRRQPKGRARAAAQGSRHGTKWRALHRGSEPEAVLKERQAERGKHPDVPFVIGFHTHMLDEELREICTHRNAITGFGTALPNADLRPFLDPQRQIADMDERQIDTHVVFTGPVHMSTWWADAPTARKLTRRLNEIVAGSAAIRSGS
jgi:hypothetical protein